MVKKLKYPFFLKCKEYEKNEYWLNIFDECAKGKFSSNISVKKDNKGIYKLFLKEKGGINHDLPVDDGFKLSQMIKKIFNLRLG